MLRTLAIVTGVLVLIFIGAAMIGGWIFDSNPDRPDLALDPDQTPETFDPNRIGSTTDITGMGRGEGGWIQQVNPQTGRLEREFRYQKLDPKVAGEFEVKQPEARIYIAPHRVVRLQSKEGYIIAPDNIPLEGTFRHDVRVTIYESPRGTKPDLSEDSPDQAAVILLDDAKFSTVLGKIDSLGKVRVQTPEAMFSGTGLTLLYNEPEQRIDFLEIAQGDKLVYQPRASAAAPVPPQQPSPDAPTPTAPAMDQGQPLQYYQVVFESAIHAESQQQTIDADQLVAIFSFSRSDSTVKSLSRSAPRVPDAMAMVPTVQAAHLNATLMATALAQSDNAPVTMTWRGKVTITPVAEKPARLQGADDVLLSFIGQPVTVRGKDDELMTCATVEYHQSLDQIGAIGSPAHPLLIDSPSMGTLTARELAIRLKDGQGVLWGAGSVRARQRDADDERGLPSGFVIGWSDRVELTIAKPDEKPAGLKAARFIGDVDVEDRRFKMNGRILQVRFEPTADGREYAFAGIDGHGQVKATAEQGSIEAEHLTLATKQVEDRIVPTLMIAKEKVKVTDFKQSIAADELQVSFSERASADTQDWQAEVDKVTARGNVVAVLDDGSRVEADTLDADNLKQTAVLNGTPLTVKREDAQLLVRQLEIVEGGAIATTTGPGQFISIRPHEDASLAPRTVNVRWSKQMKYYDKAKLLNVMGDVVVEHADSPTELNRLTAGSLELSLIDAEGTKASGPPDQRQLLRDLTAEGDVLMTSVRWETAAHEKMIHRLRISGPKLEFDNATERATVVGPGSLLAEDYSAHKQDANMGLVRVSGKGATLFTWTGSLTMDAGKTDIIFDRGVNMTHKPEDGKQLIEMQADRLTADMQGIAGIEALSTSQTSSLRIDHIEATGSVQVRDAQRLISARRLYYEGEKQTALLEAAPNEQVQIIQLNEPRPIRAEKIMWDLKRDRIEVLRGGY